MESQIIIQHEDGVVNIKRNQQLTLIIKDRDSPIAGALLSAHTLADLIREYLNGLKS